MIWINKPEDSVGLETHVLTLPSRHSSLPHSATPSLGQGKLTSKSAKQAFFLFQHFRTVDQVVFSSTAILMILVLVRGSHLVAACLGAWTLVHLNPSKALENHYIVQSPSLCLHHLHSRCLHRRLRSGWHLEGLWISMLGCSEVSYSPDWVPQGRFLGWK